MYIKEFININLDIAIFNERFCQCSVLLLNLDCEVN